MSLTRDLHQQFGDVPVIFLAESDWDRITEVVKANPELYEKLKALNVNLLRLPASTEPPEPSPRRELGPTEVHLELGTLTVTTDGAGKWTDELRSVPLRLVVETDTEIDRDEEGKISYASCAVYGYFDTSVWNVNQVGLLYTDDAVEKQVQDWLTAQGFPASGIGWSEMGMQGPDYVHFDMDFDALEKFFPDRPEFKFVVPPFNFRKA
jgi:hypothetical protein